MTDDQMFADYASFHAYLDSKEIPRKASDAVFGVQDYNLRGRYNLAEEKTKQQALDSAKLKHCKCVDEGTEYFKEMVNVAYGKPVNDAEKKKLEFAFEMFDWFVKHCKEAINSNVPPMSPDNFLKRQKEHDARYREEQRFKNVYATQYSMKIYQVALDELKKIGEMPISQQIEQFGEDFFRGIAQKIIEEGFA